MPGSDNDIDLQATWQSFLDALESADLEEMRRLVEESVAEVALRYLRTYRWVVFPALRVMSAGDIFSGKNLPLLDYNNGGSGVEIPDTLMKAYTATAKSVDSIVTGHSTVMTPNDLREYAEFNRDFLDAVRAGKKAWQSVEATTSTSRSGASPMCRRSASGNERAATSLAGMPCRVLAVQMNITFDRS